MMPVRRGVTFRAALIAVVIAGVLAVITLVTIRPSSPGRTDQATRLEIDPATVVGIHLEMEGERADVTRAEPGMPWAWTLAVQSESESWTWPVRDASVRALLRMLSTANLEPAEEIGDAVFDRSIVVVGPGEVELTVRLSTTEIAGRVLSEVLRPGGESEHAWIDASIARALTIEGLRAWRADRPLERVSGRPARIELHTPTNSVVLTRGQSRWALLEPTPARADDDAVIRLLARLEGMSLSSFLTPDESLAADLENPVARIQVHTQRGGVGPGEESVTVIREVTVGGRADLSGARVVASCTTRIGDTVFGPVLGAIEADELRDLAVAAPPYLSRSTLGDEAGEAGVLVIRAGEAGVLTARRAIGGWERVEGDVARPMTAATIENIESMLNLLSRQPAARVTAEPSASDHAFTIELRTLRQDLLAEVAIGIDSQRVLSAERQGVQRLYAADVGAPIAEWLMSLRSD